jgi:antitoxin HigA-1
MVDKQLPAVHPGEVLKTEFLEQKNITAYRLSVDIQVPQTRIGRIISGKQSISADTALRLSRYFGNSAEFWLNLQARYDIKQVQLENQEIYDRILVCK